MLLGLIFSKLSELTSLVSAIFTPFPYSQIYIKPTPRNSNNYFIFYVHFNDLAISFHSGKT